MDKMDKHFIKKLIAVSCSILTIALIILSVIYKENTAETLDEVKRLIAPFAAGAGIAYLVNFLYNKLYATTISMSRKQVDEKTSKRLRGLSLVLSELTVIVFIILIVFSIIPSLIDSIQNIGKSLPGALEQTRTTIDRVLESNSFLKKIVGSDFDTIQLKLEGYVTETLNNNIENLSKSAVSIVGNTVTWTINIIIALIVNIMLLINKDQMVVQTKMIIKATFGKYSKYIFEEAEIANSKFSGFFVGKVVDSVIIGVITFLGCLIMQIQYAGLVGFIVGIFNIIPIVGPLIGAIPSAVIIFSQSPKQSLYFIIFIVILQQIDGSVIGPKCIGQSTNINSFWVLFSITVFGKLFGFIGMLIGVPLFAVIYDIVGKLVKFRLNKLDNNNTSQLPEDTYEFVGSLIDDEEDTVDNNETTN